MPHDPRRATAFAFLAVLISIAMPAVCAATLATRYERDLYPFAPFFLESDGPGSALDLMNLSWRDPVHHEMFIEWIRASDGVTRATTDFREHQPNSYIMSVGGLDDPSRPDIFMFTPSFPDGSEPELACFTAPGPGGPAPGYLNRHAAWKLTFDNRFAAPQIYFANVDGGPETELVTLVEDDRLRIHGAGGALLQDARLNQFITGPVGSPQLLFADMDQDARLEILVHFNDGQTDRLAVIGSTTPPLATGTTPGAGTLIFRSLHPNPSRGGSAIEFDLPRADRVEVRVLDAGGRVIRTLVAGERPPGRHAEHWDGSDDAGRPAAPGVYFVDVKAGPLRQARKTIRLQ